MPRGKSSWYPLDKRLGGAPRVGMRAVTKRKKSHHYPCWEFKSSIVSGAENAEAYFKVLTQNVPGGNEKNHEIFQSGYPVSESRFKLESSRILISTSGQSM
jgi:hypothetical protein